MNDLEKMRKDFEQKLRFAEMENEFETKFGISCHVFESGNIILCTCKTDDNAIAGRILRKFPADKEMFLDRSATNDGENKHFYHLTSSRGYRDSKSTLKVEFFNNGIEYWVEVPIDGNEAIEKFFENGMRKMADFELSTYKPVRRGHICREYELPCKRFKFSHYISYSGGNLVAQNHSAIDEIVNALKNC